MSKAIFKEMVASLSSDDFRDYFLTRNNVAYPEMPKPTKEGRINADAVLENRFELIGEIFELEEGFSWQPKRAQDKEWQIAHHKFYFSVDLIHAYRQTKDPVYLMKWVALIDSWLNEMGSGFIAVSDAQVEAKRIEHWVYSFALLKGTDIGKEIPPDFLKRFLSRIATETDYITHHLKRVRNHRTFQLFSVVLVGVLFPEFQLHDYFLKTGIEKLCENLMGDILPDGVHVEQSTHYHQLVMETAVAFLDLCRLNQVPLSDGLVRRIHAGLEFSLYMQWPNGEIPLINESDNGNHLALLKKGAELFKDDHLMWAGTLGCFGRPPKTVSRHFDVSGYFVFGSDWGNDPVSYADRNHVFYDCGRLGEGSHSHYDLFNFCYYVNGLPVVIDPGRYTYSSEPDHGGIDWRQCFKSTAYHNTVTIDSKDQTRYISRQERKLNRLREKHGPEVTLTGKDFLLGRESDWVVGQAKSAEYQPVHRRVFIYLRREYLFVFDLIEMVDDESHECALYFHLTDRLSGQVTYDRIGSEAVFRSPLLEIRSDVVDGMAPCLESGWVSRKYGIKAEAPVVKLSQAGSEFLFFASLLIPVQTDNGGTVVKTLRRIPSSNGNDFSYQVHGTRRGNSFTDHFFFPKSAGSGEFQSEQVSCRGGFLTYREDYSHRVTYLIGQQIEGLRVKQGPDFQMKGAENVEWSLAANN